MKKKTKLLIRDAFFSTILTFVLVIILSVIFFNIRFFNPLHKAFNDFSFLDVYYAENFYKKDKKINDIVLVNIKDHDRLGIALLMNKILEEEPSVLGVDIIFKEQKKDAYADSVLASVLKNDKVIRAYQITKDSVIKDHSYFGKADKNSGFVNFNFDSSTSVVRQFSGKYSRDKESRFSFASRIAKQHLGKKWDEENLDKKLGTLQYINYKGNYKSFQYLEFSDFLGEEKKPILKDKVVLIGYLGRPTGNVNDITDKYYTPLNKITAGKSDADMFGLSIHANIVNMLIKNDFVTKISNFWIGIIAFLCTFFSTMYYMKLNKKYKISYRTRKQLFQLLFAVLLLLLTLLLFKNSIVLRFAPIILCVILAGSYFKYYKHLTRFINKKRKWKTYLK